MIYSETMPPDVTVCETVLPDGAVRIVVKLTADRGPCLHLLGPNTSSVSVPLRGTMKGLSLTLRPEAARALLGLPIANIAGLDLPLTEFWAEDTECLAFRLDKADGDDALADILWDAIRSRVARSSEGILPMNLYRHIDYASMRRAGNRAHPREIGERRMQQLYREYIGLSPRSSRRLARWHGLLRALRFVDRPDWAALAIEHGWYDQAHLCRDFRSFSRLTPGEYFSRAFSRSSKTMDTSIE